MKPAIAIGTLPNRPQWGLRVFFALLATALPALAETFTFNAASDNDFLNTANWSAGSGGTPTPATMGAADTYVVAANAQLNGSASVSGALTVNAGVTLTVGAAGSLTLNGGADVTVADTGVLSNYGTLTCLAGTNGDPTTLVTGNGNGGVVNQAGATFTRAGSGSNSQMGGRFLNHGSFDESGGEWLGVFFENSVTGTAVIRGSQPSAGNYDTSWTNAGVMTSHRQIGNFASSNSGTSTFSNSGTLNLLSGTHSDQATSNSNSGTLNVKGSLGGLNNTGTVNLTGPTLVQPAWDGDFANNGTLNQGAHLVTVVGFSGYSQKVRNLGTWTGSGGFNFSNDAKLELAAGTLTSDGPWTFTALGGNGSGVSVGISGTGTLAGTAALTLPATATGLTLGGGTLAASLTTAAPVSVTADSIVSGALVLDHPTMTINAGVTLTVAVGGTLTLNGGADVTVADTGVLSNYGTLTCLAGTNGDPTTLVTGNGNGGVVNQAGATFTRAGSGSNSQMGGRFLNHGSFDESGGEWLGVFFENSVTGTAVIRGSQPSAGNYDTSWTNAGVMTSHRQIGNFASSNSGTSTFSNSGTLNLLSGTHSDQATSNSNSGTLNVKGSLGGLNNTGTVNLTGPTLVQPAWDGDFANNGTLNQGAHLVTVVGFSGYSQKVRNLGTWTGSGGFNFSNDAKLELAAGTLTSDGPWTFTANGGNGSGVSVGISGTGTLAGTAALSLPTTATGLTLGGGDLAASLTTAAPVSITADSIVSGALTLMDTNVTGANLLTVSGKLATAGSGTSTMACNLTLNRATGRVLEIAPGTTLQNSGSVTFTAGEAMVHGMWQHGQSPLQALPGTTVAGDGTIIGNLRVWATLKPGPEAGTGDLNVQGNLQLMPGSTTAIRVAGGGVSDRILTTGNAELRGTLAVDFSAAPLASPGTYEFIVPTSGSVLWFESTSPSSLAPTRGFSYSTGSPRQFTIAVTGTPYQDWSFASGLTAGVNDDPLDDANGDGILNIQHFAFDTHPITSHGGDEGKRRTGFVDAGADPHFAHTVPIRRGAVFIGSPGLVSSKDGVDYRIEGSANLQTWLLSVSESAPADSAGLPPLRDIDGDGTADWEYRTFILDDHTLPSGFLRANGLMAPP